MQPPAGEPRPRVSQLLRDLSENMSSLLRHHLELARVEFQDNAKKIARDASFTAVGAFVALIGYGLFAVAVSIGLGQKIGMARGFLLVSAFHVIVGGLLATVFARRLRTTDKPSLDETTHTLQRDREFLGEVRQLLRADRRALP